MACHRPRNIPPRPKTKRTRPPPSAEIPCSARAREDTARDRWQRDYEEDDGDPQSGDADGIRVETLTACGVERVKEHRLVLHLLVAVPPEQRGDSRLDAVEQLPAREQRVADLAEEVLTRHRDRAAGIARGPVDDREPTHHGIRDGIDRHAPPHENPIERRVHGGVGGLLAKEGIALGAQRLVGDTGQQAPDVVDEEGLQGVVTSNARLDRTGTYQTLDDRSSRSGFTTASDCSFDLRPIRLMKRTSHHHHGPQTPQSMAEASSASAASSRSSAICFWRARRLNSAYAFWSPTYRH
jgi:hypothetical protein